MKQRHMQEEMDCWQPQRVDPDAASFFRGLVCGVAIGAVMWTVILVWIWP